MEIQQKAGRFGRLGPACLIYALFFTFCLYENISGIMFPVFVAGTVFLSWKLAGKNSVKLSDAEQKTRISGWMDWFCPSALLMIGISVCLTDAFWLYALDLATEIFLFLSYLLHLTARDRQGDFWNRLAALIKTVFGSIGCIFYPFADAEAFHEMKKAEKEEGQRIFKSVAIGLLAALPLVIIVIWLLASADLIFSGMLSAVFGKFAVPEHFARIGAMILLGFFASYCGFSFLEKKQGKREPEDCKKRDSIAGIAFASVFLAVYLIFSGIQGAFLIIGGGILPAGTTYAEYVHQGFYQLLAVSAINFVLVTVCESFFERRKALSLVLTGISACTYILLTVSAVRMMLYIQAYDMTVLRLFVLFLLVLLGFFMGGVTVRLYFPGFCLYEYTAAVLAAGCLIFTLLCPDALIARYNLSRGNTDMSYLCGLSADAAPVLFSSPEFSADQEYLQIYKNHLEKILDSKSPEDFRTFNFSRARASGLLKEYSVQESY